MLSITLDSQVTFHADEVATSNASMPVNSADRAHRRAASAESLAQGLTPTISPLAGAGPAMSQSSQYTPPIPATWGDVAAQTCVAAPCSAS